MSQDLAGLTLVELATAIADGSITSVAATTWSLERLRRIGPQLNCIAVLSDDAVLAQATLARPAEIAFVSTGKHGVHSEHMGLLLAEMQTLARQHPGATW
jgi:Asp-tRNA(Asn)/Glu-tRNA(Gln) amidotransferase A subunit family amidase